VKAEKSESVKDPGVKSSNTSDAIATPRQISLPHILLSSTAALSDTMSLRTESEKKTVIRQSVAEIIGRTPNGLWRDPTVT